MRAGPMAQWKAFSEHTPCFSKDIREQRFAGFCRPSIGLALSCEQLENQQTATAAFPTNMFGVSRKRGFAAKHIVHS